MLIPPGWLGREDHRKEVCLVYLELATEVAQTRLECLSRRWGEVDL